MRKQTLTNAERYITPELKELEDTILGSQDRLVNLEYDLSVRSGMRLLQMYSAFSGQQRRLQRLMYSFHSHWWQVRTITADQKSTRVVLLISKVEDIRLSKNDRK